MIVYCTVYSIASLKKGRTSYMIFLLEYLITVETILLTLMFLMRFSVIKV